MLNYSETPARELERILEDLSKYLIIDLAATEEQCLELDKLFNRLANLRQYMHDVKFVKETV
jgi:hypothetical protein